MPIFYYPFWQSEVDYPANASQIWKITEAFSGVLGLL